MPAATGAACGGPLVILSRELVLDRICEDWGYEPWTTRCLADRLGEAEYAVRAVVAWLHAGGLVERRGTLKRRDRSGRLYYPQAYGWTGRTAIGDLPRSPSERRQAAQQSDLQLAAYWLSRPWR